MRPHSDLVCNKLAMNTTISISIKWFLTIGIIKKPSELKLWKYWCINFFWRSYFTVCILYCHKLSFSISNTNRPAWHIFKNEQRKKFWWTGWKESSCMLSKKPSIRKYPSQQLAILQQLGTAKLGCNHCNRVCPIQPRSKQAMEILIQYDSTQGKKLTRRPRVRIPGFG